MAQKRALPKTIVRILCIGGIWGGLAIAVLVNNFIRPNSDAGTMLLIVVPAGVSTTFLLLWSFHQRN